MLKKFLFFLGLFFTLFIATSANAGWKANSNLSGVYDYKVRDEVVARYLGIPQYPQPTTYTCGATTISMFMLWESHKKGRGIKFSPMSIHNYVNSKDPKGKTSGLTTTELKAGIKKVAGYIKDKGKLQFNIEWYEGKHLTYQRGIESIAYNMKKNFSPAIIYGKVNIPSSRNGYQISPGASAGGHYYLATGVVQCPKHLCKGGQYGLFINDSVYESEAWGKGSIIRKAAVSPRKLILKIDLKHYWPPTGHKIPWKRRYMVFHNTSRKA